MRCLWLALEEKLISTNPFADVSIRVPKKVINREDGKAFSDKEQQVIVRAALAIKDTKSPSSSRGPMQQAVRDTLSAFMAVRLKHRLGPPGPRGGDIPI